MQKKIIIRAITEIIDGKMVAVASTENQDRTGDSLKANKWDFKNFKRNPVLQAGHDYKPQFTVGGAKNIRVDGTRVLFEPVFHGITQLAREIGEMYKQGFLRAWSVGFLPGKDEKSKNELLEISAVAVPANADALVIAKGMDSKEEKEVKEKLSKFIKEEIKDKGKKKGEKIDDQVIGKPFPNEHACRLRSPGGFTPGSFRRISRRSKGKLYSVIMGKLKGETTMTEQAYRYKKTAWSASEAGAHCKAHDGSFEAASKEKIIKKKGKKFAERWNKQLPVAFNKAFDIEALPSNASIYSYDIYSKFLDCKVKNIYLHSYVIPSPMLGTYLTSFKELLSKYILKDERNFSFMGGEQPLIYEVIPMTIDKSDDFLIEGTQFYEKKNGKRFIMNWHPTWYGMTVDIVSKIEHREWNKKFLSKVHKHADKNNLLKGQAFSLSGEFLEKTGDKWEDLVLPKITSDPVHKAVSQLRKLGKNAKSRGLMFIGKPGTGKTKTGKVLMNDVKEAAFIWMSTRDFDRVGPLTAIKMGFKLARKIAPAILFLEDIDKFLREYAVDLLKTEMDGIKTNKGIITILTSNTPEEFPEALIDRPGRFHDILEFSLPSKELRKEMLMKWTELDKDDELISTIVARTEGYSGAHMRELVDYAEMIAEDDGLAIGEALLMSLEKLMKQRRLINNLKKEKSIEIKKVDLNEKMVNDIVTQTITALEKLLETPEDTPQKVEGSNVKGRTTRVAHKQLTRGELVVRVLKKVAQTSNYALNQLNKNRK